jgi:transcriptional regulator with XRE-family HTH domain
MDAPYRVFMPRDEEPAQGDGGRWGEFLREITARPGWTVARLAEKSGIHRSTLFRWMNGSVRNINIESVRLVADAAGVNMATALHAASDLVTGTPARDMDELTDEVARILDDSGLPEDDRFAIAQMLLEEFDRDEQTRRQLRADRARATVETWKRARGA